MTLCGNNTKVMSSTNVEALQLHNAGQENYQEGNYNTALAKFTEALEVHNIPITVKIAILQNRATTLEMIGGSENLAMALLDTQLVMSYLSEIQAEEYLQVERIHQLLDQDEYALKVYAEGIKQLKPDIKQFKV